MSNEFKSEQDKNYWVPELETFLIPKIEQSSHISYSEHQRNCKVCFAHLDEYDEESNFEYHCLEGKKLGAIWVLKEFGSMLKNKDKEILNSYL